MLGGQVLLLPVGLAGATGQGQEWDLGGRDASVITVSSGGPWGVWALARDVSQGLLRQWHRLQGRAAPGGDRGWTWRL
ncbi:unnamed protein product, partial [Bubo scandiacus]